MNERIEEIYTERIFFRTQKALINDSIYGLGVILREEQNKKNRLTTASLNTVEEEHTGKQDYSKDTMDKGYIRGNQVLPAVAHVAVQVVAELDLHSHSSAGHQQDTRTT